MTDKKSPEAAMMLSNDAKLVTFINVFTVEQLQRMIETVPQTSPSYTQNQAMHARYALHAR
jgi:hypothetical protein